LRHEADAQNLAELTKMNGSRSTKPGCPMDFPITATIVEDHGPQLGGESPGRNSWRWRPRCSMATLPSEVALHANGIAALGRDFGRALYAGANRVKQFTSAVDLRIVGAIITHPGVSIFKIDTKVDTRRLVSELAGDEAFGSRTAGSAMTVCAYVFAISEWQVAHGRASAEVERRAVNHRRNRIWKIAIGFMLRRLGDVAG
jgi:hypothetical protein